jgi:hypothetical protein
MQVVSPIVIVFAQVDYDSQWTGTAKKVKGKLSEAAERWKWESSRLSSALSADKSMQLEATGVDSGSILTENNRLPTENNRLPVENNRLPIENNRLPIESNRLPTEINRLPIENNMLTEGNPVDSGSLDVFTPSRYDLFHYATVRTPVTDYLQPGGLLNDGEAGQGEGDDGGGEEASLGLHEAGQSDYETR